MRFHLFPRVAALLLALSASSFANGRCSAQVLRGSWAYQGRGTVMIYAASSASPVPVPFTVLGIWKVDDQGRFAAQATISVGGQIQEMNFSGAIEVDGDCAATATYQAGFTQGADRLLILDHGNEMRSLPMKSPLGPVSASYQFRRLSWGDSRCSTGMVTGSYAGWREGTLLMPVSGQPQPAPVPFSALVRFTVQPDGAVTASSIASMGGLIMECEMPRASLEVSSDCTAILKWTGNPKGAPDQVSTGTLKYIVLNGGSELMGMDLQTSTAPSIVIENDRRVSAPAAARQW